ncbi:ATP-dependent DNA helicase [Actinomadura atramentaria]|uniref:ATP-dependent DNA helicase n=1 Tax=Actinomadura atramentaria TaxID=1990 RepID=UPI000373A007|nr:ATP-dependent DNA helicase [Actinomadura atramentaria]
MPAPELLTDAPDDAPAPGDAPDLDVLLAAAVEAVGGAERPGQVAMARAVEHAIASGEHVAAQAGTGTGKSLAYLVPALRHAVTRRTTVVVSTATIALQRQLVDRDLPRLAEALRPHLDVEPKFAILKGRRNYLCLHRVQTGAPDDDDGEGLFDPQQLSSLGRQVKRLHEWADETTTGDRDELVPGVGEQAWRQVAVSARECLGATRCPQGTECFAERARAAAGEAHIVVTNHALLAIDALEDFQVLPEHDVVIVDEAHELVDRVTSVATGELSGPGVASAAKRLGRLVEDAVADRLAEAGEALGSLLDDLPDGRMDVLSHALGTTLAVLRDAAHGCQTALGPERKEADPADAGARKAARSALEDLHDTAVRLLDAFVPEISARTEVVWLAKPFAPEGRPSRPPTLHVAPIGVGGLLRGTLFEDRTTVLTSATLTLGGSFEPLARQWGLPPLGAAAEEKKDDAKPLKWSGLDVGSPFDHPKSGILYVARHLPQPGRDGLADACLTEITELVEAAGGRTLGLFSSMRAARQAADELKDHLSHPLLCQGDDATALLVKRFAEEERTCLFGTLSLWQGVDVPGPSLQLVIMDRIPFPRPDDPVASARQRAVAAHGGNGFMAVAATHAALLLAQGAGRLLRSMDDRGVVAVLDPRLATARYGSFLKNSLPPFWATTDPQVARGALRRLDAAAG